MNCALYLAGAKSINIIVKFYLFLTMRKSDFFDLLSNYLFILVLRFVVMFCSNVGSENSGAGHIKCVHGP